MRDNAFRPYVPGSSVKGALRTVLLYQAMQEQGYWAPGIGGTTARRTVFRSGNI